MKRDGCPGMLQQYDSDYLFARCLVTRNGCNMGPPLASEFGTIWVEYVDCKVYDWQGFVVQGRLQVERCGKALINCQTGTDAEDRTFCWREKSGRRHVHLGGRSDQFALRHWQF
jgi:hypothetical protein